MSWIELWFMSVCLQYGAIQQLELLQDQLTGQSIGAAHLIFATSQAAADAVSACSLSTFKQQFPQQLQSIKVQAAQQQAMFQTQYIGSSINTPPEQHTAASQLPDHSTTLDTSPHVSSGVRPGSSSQIPDPRYSGQFSQQAILGQQIPQQLQHVVSDASSSSLSSAVPSQQPQSKQEAEQPKTPHHTLFFAKVPRSASRSAVLELFSAFGEVVDLNLFAESPDAPLSKGCGLVMFAELDVALMALQQLGGKYMWAGMRSPMVLKLMNPEAKHKHQQRPEQQRRPGQYGLSPYAAGSSSASGRMGSQWALGQHQQQAAVAMGQPGLLLQAQQQQPEQMPAGCSSDAFKLFVGNIPKSYSAAALRPVFESIGPVAELVVIRDKATSDSKGSAFVWYTTGAHAEQAIQQLNMRVVLPGYGPQESAHSRPLVVKRATQQWRPQFPPTVGAGAAGAPALSVQAAPMLSSALAARGAARTVLHPQLLQQQQPTPALLGPVAAPALIAAETGQAGSSMPGQQIMYVPQATSQAIRRHSGGAAVVRPASASPRPTLTAVPPAAQAVPPFLVPAQQLQHHQQIMALPQQYVTYSAALPQPQGQPVTSTGDVLERFALLQLQQQQQVLGGVPVQGLQPQMQLHLHEAAASGYNLAPTAAVPQNPQAVVGVYPAVPSGQGNPGVLQRPGQRAFVEGYTHQLMLGAVQGYPQPAQAMPGVVQGYPQAGQVLSGAMQGYSHTGQMYPDVVQGYPQAGQAVPGTMQGPAQAGQVLSGSMQGYLQAGQALPASLQGYSQAGQAVSDTWPGYPVQGQIMPVGLQGFDAAQVPANPQPGMLPNPVGVPSSSGAAYIVPGMQDFQI
eukprot:GHUV01007063.1.p1 GENE.GHUV01007063.1~~GHUV01007063.1.p1  ORF type:complete len:848 (+),score=312.04 GHUV01007063.1:768-3311(+)